MLCRRLIQSAALFASRVNGDEQSSLRQCSAVDTGLGILPSAMLARVAISLMTPVVRKRMVGRIETLPAGREENVLYTP